MYFRYNESKNLACIFCELLILTLMLLICLHLNRGSLQNKKPKLLFRLWVFTINVRLNYIFMSQFLTETSSLMIPLNSEIVTLSCCIESRWRIVTV